jgi:polyphosphate kinase 2 (PPK2 family)
VKAHSRHVSKAALPTPVRAPEAKALRQRMVEAETHSIESLDPVAKQAFQQQAVALGLVWARGEPARQRVVARAAERWSQLLPEGAERSRATGLRFLLDGSLRQAQECLPGMKVTRDLLVDERSESAPARHSEGMAWARRLFPELKVPRQSQHVLPSRVSSANHPARWAERSAESVLQALAETPMTAEQAGARLVEMGFSPTSRPTRSFAHGHTRVQLEPLPLSSDAPAFRVVIWDRHRPGKSLVRTTVVSGTRFHDEDWSYFQTGYDKTVHRAALAFETAQGLRAQPEGLIQLRQLLDLGRPASERAEVSAERSQLLAIEAKISAKLTDLQAHGKAPKGVFIMVDGVDAASKTSNGQEVLSVFGKAGYATDWSSFKAATPEEKAEFWLKRYQRHQPPPQGAFLADRSPLGDFAYDLSKGDVERARMGADFSTWEAQMKDQGILVFKFLFDPQQSLDSKAHAERHRSAQWRAMETFGKREGRGVVARDVLAREELLGKPEEALTQLRNEALGPSAGDLKSYFNGVDTEQRFRAMAKDSGQVDPWVVVPSEDRHPGRLKVLQAVLDRLEALDAA